MPQTSAPSTSKVSDTVRSWKNTKTNKHLKPHIVSKNQAKVAFHGLLQCGDFYEPICEAGTLKLNVGYAVSLYRWK